jgi:hypothetical protein
MRARRYRGFDAAISALDDLAAMLDQPVAKIVASGVAQSGTAACVAYRVMSVARKEGAP